MQRILALTFLLSACASSPHRHVVGEGVTCPHRSHANEVIAPAKEIIAGDRLRYQDAVSAYPDHRAGAAVYEGDVDFTVRSKDAGD